MERSNLLVKEVLTELRFKFYGGVWIHFQEKCFAIKLEPTCFFISFHGYLAKNPYNLTVGELERLFYERTGRLLY